MVGRRRAAVAALLAPLVLAACSAGEEPPASTAPIVRDRSTELLPPERLRVAAKAFRVTLRWGPPAGGIPPEKYDIYRDGRFVASVPGDQTRYVDTDVVPKRRYRWAVLAGAGSRESGRVRARAATKVPPLAAARVQGYYDVLLDVTSHSGYSRIDETYRLEWSLFARCLAGPCARVDWTDRARKITGTLTRAGRTYTGTYTGPFLARCGETATSATVTIELRVERARGSSGEWVATRLSGRLSTYEPAQAGCVTSRLSSAVRLRLERWQL